jgi:glycosyltransferase involved in cell wall biosynthesis
MILDNEYLTDTRVSNEARHLVQHGHEVYVLCINFDSRPHFETVEGVNIVRFNMKRSRKNKLAGIVNTFPLYDRIWTKEIKKLIAGYRVEALHAHDLYMAKATHDANMGFNLPVTLDLHENYPAAVKGYTWANSFPRKLLVKPDDWKKKEHRYLSYADHIVVLSEAFRQTLCGEYPDLAVKKFAVYPNVPDVDWFLSLPADRSILDHKTGFVLFYFGVIGIRRGMVTCFEALKQLIPNIPEIRLMLMGPVDKADQTLFNHSLNDPVIKDHVIYHRWKDVKELPSYVLASDVCLAPYINSPQHDSGIANKVFQYMLFERPVLLCNSMPHQMLVNETHCGYVFKDTDASDFANVVLKMYHDPGMCREMGRNGKKAVLGKYNLETAGKELDGLYQN